MHVRHILIACLVGALCVAACQPSPIGPAGNPKGATKKPSAPPSASAQPSASASLSVSPTPGAYFGRVLGVDGQPVAGVTVRGYLISNNGGGIVSNNGSGLIGNNSASYRLQQAGGETATPEAFTGETQTDAKGQFKLVDPQNRPLNLEADDGAELKAIRFAVPATASGVELKLAPTGTIAGTVKSATATDLTGVDVFVPGTGYAAKTAAGGTFTLTGVPVGTFTLFATKRALGRAIAENVVVASKQSTTAPDLVLEVEPPVLTSITPPNGGPGVEVTLSGDKFGLTTGQDLTVAFGGATASNPVRVDDKTLKVKVPDGAESGDVVVTVDGVQGTPKPFTVIKTLATSAAIHDMRPGAEVRYRVTASDTKGQRVVSPTLTWSVVGTGFTVDQTGLVKATAAGTGTLKVASGTVQLAEFPLVAHDTPWLLSTLAGLKTLSPFDQPEDYVPQYEGYGLGVEFYQPRGLVLGPDGFLYVADMRGILYKVGLDGEATIFAGGPVAGYADGLGKTARFTEPAGLTRDDEGNLYVCDKGTVRKVAKDGTVTTLAGSSTTGFVNGTGTAARFKSAHAIARDAAGNLYVVDQGNAAIRKVTPAGEVTTLAGGVPKTGFNDRTYTDGTGTAAKFADPTDIALGPDGHLYVADAGAGRIRKVTTGGEVTTLTGYDGVDPNSTLNDGPVALTVAPDGTIFFGGFDGYIHQLTAGGALSTVAPGVSGLTRSGDGVDAKAGLRYVHGLCRDAKGSLYFTEWEYDYVQQRIRKLDLKP